MHIRPRMHLVALQPASTSLTVKRGACVSIPNLNFACCCNIYNMLEAVMTDDG